MSPSIARYRREKQAACQALLAGSRLHETSHGPVECTLIGEGPAVLISHGGGGGYDMAIWLGQLIGGEYHFVAPSRFGYLRTPLPPNPTPEAQADTYAALLDTLDINSCFIIGLSAGGPSALQFALRHTERCLGLIMISAISCSLPPLPPILRAIYPLILRSDFFPWFLYAIAPDAVYRANGVNRALLAQIKPNRQKMDSLRALYRTTFPVSPRRDGIISDMRQTTSLPPYPLEQINVPTLVVHAIDDPIVPFDMGEFTAQTIPGAEFITLSEGGHFCSVTHRESVMPTLQEFLHRHRIPV